MVTGASGTAYGQIPAFSQRLLRVFHPVPPQLRTDQLLS